MLNIFVFKFTSLNFDILWYTNSILQYAYGILQAAIGYQRVYYDILMVYYGMLMVYHDMQLVYYSMQMVYYSMPVKLEKNTLRLVMLKTKTLRMVFVLISQLINSNPNPNINNYLLYSWIIIQI